MTKEIQKKIRVGGAIKMNFCNMNQLKLKKMLLKFLPDTAKTD